MRLAALVVLLCTSFALAETNLITNGDQLAKAKITPTGAARLGPQGDPNRDISPLGFALDSTKPSGAITTVVDHLDSKQGRWFRFEVRGLPQRDFAVDDDDLFLRVAFFGSDGKTSYDEKDRKIYDLVTDARRDFTVNGDHGRGGAEAWQTYLLDFYLPFPQVDSAKLSVGFDHGKGKSASNSSFLINAIKLTRIPTPSNAPDAPTTAPLASVTEKDLIHIGGRWFYLPKSSETTPPKEFNTANAERLLYHDDVFSAPFAGNTSAWLRAGNMDAKGIVLTADKLVDDNLTIRFDGESMILHTHNIPNHATGKYPEQGFGNPSHIIEQDLTYYIPIEPKLNANAKITTQDNSNGALHMGPIGIAVNGVVFFNPFDAQSTVAVDQMDRCCGHPNQDGLYHYHKYPICVNSPWSDEGRSHSPLIGFAFDGLPLYGPYESTDVMAKDLTGEHALNGFNAHYDEQRGWHYHVTPGKFPYLIGGYFATEDSRDNQRPKHPMGARGGNERGPSNGRRGGPPGNDNNGDSGDPRQGPPGGGPMGNRPPPPPFGDGPQ